MKPLITTVQYAESTLPEDMIFPGGDKNRSQPIVFRLYLIDLANRRILIDAGCETMPGFDMKNFVVPPVALRNIGIDPEEITDLVITHAHHDHIECTKYFPNAIVHIHKDAYERGKKYIPQGFSLHLFDGDFTLAKGVEVRVIGGHARGSSIVVVGTGDKKTAIIGDECYKRECLEKRIPTGNSVSPERSLDFINEYSRECYEVLLAHDQ